MMQGTIMSLVLEETLKSMKLELDTPKFSWMFGISFEKINNNFKILKLILIV